MKSMIKTVSREFEHHEAEDNLSILLEMADQLGVEFAYLDKNRVITFSVDLHPAQKLGKGQSRVLTGGCYD